ncbi:hypothetical protein ACQKWADRAFT_281847, partial [Trichoderma austrokoningii]
MLKENFTARLNDTMQCLAVVLPKDENRAVATLAALTTTKAAGSVTLWRTSLLPSRESLYADLD